MIVCAFLFTVVPRANLDAQGTEIDLALGPTLRDLRLVESTNRVGIEVRFGVAHHFDGRASIGITASAYQFVGASSITLLNVGGSGFEPRGVAGFFAPSGKAVFRWDLQASRSGPFVEVGAGRLGQRREH